MTIQAQQLAELSTQLSQARAQRSDAQARARLIRELMERGQAAEAREVSGSGLIQRLQEERVRRASQIAELSTTLLPAHPRMKELNAQVRNLDQQIRNEIEKIVGGLENDAAVAAARELQIEKNIEQLKSSVALANESEVELRALEREAKAQRDLLSAYLTRYREAAARSDNAFAPAFARVISPATVPLKPYFPSKLGIPLLATIGAFIVSAGVVITLELASAYSMLPQARLGPAAVPAGQEGRTREQATPVQPEAVPGQGIVSDFDAVSPPAPPVRTAGADSGPKRECARAARAVQPGTAETTPGQAGTQAHAQAPQKANVAPQAASGAASPAADAGEQSVSAAMRRAAALFARSHPELQGGEEADARSEPAPAKPPAGAAVSEAMQVRESSRAEPAPADATSADLTFENVMVVTSIGEQGVCFQTALLHARQSAAKGLRVILVDTTEGPDGAETLGPDVPAQGYYDLVEERAQFAEVMFRDPESSLHLIAAAALPARSRPTAPCRSTRWKP